MFFLLNSVLGLCGLLGHNVVVVYNYCACMQAAAAKWIGLGNR